MRTLLQHCIPDRVVDFVDHVRDASIVGASTVEILKSFSPSEPESNMPWTLNSVLGNMVKFSA
jgi:hypothetical protein